MTSLSTLPKPLPVTVMTSPLAPVVGLTLVIIGVASTVKLNVVVSVSVELLPV